MPRISRLPACLVAATAGVLLVAQSAAIAASTPYANRARARLGGEYASGAPINGVTSKLLVPNDSRFPTINVASDIYMSSGNVFVQFGVLVGREYIGTKVPRSGGGCMDGGPRSFFAGPHLFLGAVGPGEPCETLRDLGPFGSSGDYRQFGLRRNSNGTYYATLDGVTKYTTAISFPAAMQPGVVAEVNETCGFVRTDARDQADFALRTLAWHDEARGWQFWTTQYMSQELQSPSSWSIFRPYGGDTYHADGANPPPAGC